MFGGHGGTVRRWNSYPITPQSSPSLTPRDPVSMHLLQRISLVACCHHFSFSARRIPGYVTQPLMPFPDGSPLSPAQVNYGTTVSLGSLSCWYLGHILQPQLLHWGHHSRSRCPGAPYTNVGSVVQLGVSYVHSHVPRAHCKHRSNSLGFGVSIG